MKKTTFAFRLILCITLTVVLCIFSSACSSKPIPGPENDTIAASQEPLPVQETGSAEERSEENPEEQYHYIELAGNTYRSDRQYIILHSDEICLEDLYEAIPIFDCLKSVDIRSTCLTAEDGLELTEHFPEVNFIWNNNVFDKIYQSDISELDISGKKLHDPSEAEEIVRYFPRLRKIIMSDCGISNEDMDTLNRKYDDIRFVWTVRFNCYSLRTDAEYFCASDVPFKRYIAPRLNEYHLQPLKYCTDLIALDLGHMNFTNIEFLSGMTKLKYLVLVQGKFSDLTPLENMKDLEYLELFTNNLIVDLTPLLSCKNLKHLNIGYCSYAEWESLKEMKQLERLWMPHVIMTKEEKEELKEALPDTYIYCPDDDSMGSTGGGWRDDQSYFDMRDALHMFYLPGGTGMG